MSEGLLTRRQGAGTFVAARVEKSFSGLSSFTQDMLARGSRPSSRWLSRSQGQVTPEEALSLALSPGTPVYRFHRLRLADERPLAVVVLKPGHTATEEELIACLAPHFARWWLPDAVEFVDNPEQDGKGIGVLVWRGTGR